MRAALQRLFHDIRNQQSVVLSSCELIELSLTRCGCPGSERLTEHVGRIRKATEFTLGMIAPPEAAAACDLNQMLIEAAQFIQAPPARVKVLHNLDTTEPRIVGDRDLIRRAIFNLLINAREATDAQPVPVIILTSHVSAHEIAIRISDNGRGMDAAQKASLLTRAVDGCGGYSSKSGPGHGHGFAIVRTTFEALGGAIACDSAPGLGTTFHITLPRG